MGKTVGFIIDFVKCGNTAFVVLVPGPATALAGFGDFGFQDGEIRAKKKIGRGGKKRGGFVVLVILDVCVEEYRGVYMMDWKERVIARGEEEKKDFCFFGVLYLWTLIKITISGPKCRYLTLLMMVSGPRST